MLTPVKWFSFGLLTIFMVLSIAFFSTVQNTTTHSTSEVEAIAESVAVGELRSGLNDYGEGFSGEEVKVLDKDDLIANITASLVSVQRTHGYDVRFDYLFLDKEGEMTEDETEIESIQFRVVMVDDDGDTKGTAERRIVLNQFVE